MDLRKVKQETLKMRAEREWDKLDNLKDLAESLVIESSELMELFLWKNENESMQMLKDSEKRERIEDELSDVLLNIICFADLAEIELEKAALKKIKKIEEKYPLHKAKGNNKKYTEFE
ncbi:MAG: nucleotide pyrophosphohydrolase [Candidatus Diapherotrites archaeon]|nr:nucleotide pyrophosphohydrolase [Candidatus Diapherotrites archaeon]